MHSRTCKQLIVFLIFAAAALSSDATASGETSWTFTSGAVVTFQVGSEDYANSDRILFRDERGVEKVIFTGRLTEVTSQRESPPLRRGQVAVKEWIFDPLTFPTKVIAAGIDGKIALIDSGGRLFSTEVPSANFQRLRSQAYNSYGDDMYHWISLQFRQNQGEFGDTGATMILRRSDRRVLPVAKKYYDYNVQFEERNLALPGTDVKVDLDRFAVLQPKPALPSVAISEPLLVENTSRDIACSREFQRLAGVEFLRGSPLGRYGVPDSIVPPLKKPQ